jgi:hypothetical protein
LAIGGSLDIAGDTVLYDVTTSTEGGTFYFAEDELVISSHGSLLLLYKNGLPTLEAHDTNNDGTPDTYITLTPEGDVTGITGDATETFTRPPQVDLATLIADGEGKRLPDHSTEDLVGSLDSITVPRYHNYILYGFLIILSGGGYWWYRRRK